MSELIDKEKLMEELKQLRNHYIYNSTGLPSQAVNDAMVIVASMKPERIGNPVQLLSSHCESINGEE